MKRYLQLDFLRGLCLLVMTVDHFGELSLVELFGFLSAAEAFVFISGLVAGIVYYRRLQTNSYQTIKASAVQRSFVLYKYHVLCLLALAVVLVSGLPFYQAFYENKVGLFADNVLLASLLNMIFLYKTYHLDILPMYVIFLLFVPVALKYANTQIAGYLLLVSFVLWFVNLFGATDFFYSWLNHFFYARAGNFQLLGWQFLFFLGFSLGVLEVKGKLDLLKNNRWVFAFSLSILALLFVLNGIGITRPLPEALKDILFGKSTIGIIRMLNFLALSSAIVFVFNRYPRLGKNGMLRLLGRHSLYVFTFQTIVLFVLIPFYQEYFIHDFLTDHFDSKMIRKALSLATAVPLSLIIFVPALLKERKAGKQFTNTMPEPTS